MHTLSRIILISQTKHFFFNINLSNGDIRHADVYELMFKFNHDLM